MVRLVPLRAVLEHAHLAAHLQRYGARAQARSVGGLARHKRGEGPALEYRMRLLVADWCAAAQRFKTTG